MSLNENEFSEKHFFLSQSKTDPATLQVYCKT